jgi:hypothetical protein
MKEDNYSLLLIGDFAYFMNSAIILWGSLALFSQLLHYWKYYKNESPSYLKPLEMICGLVSPKSIGLTNREDINQLLNKSKRMFQFSKFLNYGLCFGCYCTTGMVLIINSTPSLYWIQLLWTTFFTIASYHFFNINLSQMTYFYVICLYLKLKLRNANNSIRENSDKKYKMSYLRMKNILKSLDSIICEINAYNNDFWSKYLMAVLITVILVVDLVFL